MLVFLFHTSIGPNPVMDQTQQRLLCGETPDPWSGVAPALVGPWLCQVVDRAGFPSAIWQVRDSTEPQSFVFVAWRGERKVPSLETLDGVGVNVPLLPRDFVDLTDTSKESVSSVEHFVIPLTSLLSFNRESFSGSVSSSLPIPELETKAQ